MRLALVSVLVLSATCRAADRPNILLLFADDQRADTIGAWGNPNIDTPNIDSLVKRGFSFKQNYCFGSNSGAVCVPSRAMLHTGKHWIHSNNQMKGEITLGQTLQTQGYKTFCTGKWHNGPQSILRSFETGSAIYMGGMCDHTQVPLQDIKGGELVNKRFGNGFSSTLFADAMIGFLKNHEGDKPFFAYAAFTSPHDPRQPPEPYRQKYYDNRPPLPANFLPHHPFNNGFMSGRDESLAPWPRPKDVVSDQLAEYYGMVEHLDVEIGRILKTLKATGKADNTIIIYAADHGLAMGSHGLLGKQSVYEHSMRCPLVFVGDGIPAGQSTNAFSYLLDIYPTVMSLTSTKPSAEIAFDGKDLSPIWKGETEKVRDEVYLQYTSHQRSVREERWKLIRYPQIHHTQLFDLQNDPHEMKNLADSPDHKAHVERLMGKLSAWQAAWGDKLPLTSKQPNPKKFDFSRVKRTPDRWQPKWIRDKYYGGANTSPKGQEQNQKMREQFGKAG